MNKPNRPSIPKIRKAFNSYLCQDIKGYEITMWDLLHWVDLQHAMHFFTDTTGLPMGVCEEFEREPDRVVEDWIKQKAWERK
jgi:hypothetical protein